MGEEVHTQIVVDQLDAMGERIRDANDQYRGLSAAHLVELLKELQARRESAARLRAWFADNGVKKFPGEHTDDAALRILETARAALSSIIPVVSQMWATYADVFRKLGVKLPDSR